MRDKESLMDNRFLFWIGLVVVGFTDIAPVRENRFADALFKFRDSTQWYIREVKTYRYRILFL